MTDLIVATDAGRASGGAALAAALGVVIALGNDGDGRVLIVEHGRSEPRRPTMLASRGARTLEEELRVAGEPLSAAVARGQVCFLALPSDSSALAALAVAATLVGTTGTVIAYVSPELWSLAIGREDLPIHAALLRADTSSDRSLAALAVAEAHQRGLRVRIATRALGLVGSRRAWAGLDPGGSASSRVTRLARGLVAPRRRSDVGAERQGLRAKSRSRSARPIGVAPRADSGQILPAVLLSAVLVLGVSLALTAILGAVTGKGRLQRAADLIALSAARSMRDEFPRLFTPPRRTDGSRNHDHLAKDAYLDRAVAAALEAGRRNAVARDRVRVDFPDAGSFAPVRVRVALVAELDGPSSRHRGEGRADRRRSQADGEDEVRVLASAIATPTEMAAPDAPSPPRGGGEYAGPLVYRQGKAMRADVALAFDRLAAGGRRAGFALAITSAHRSDAEQGRLFAMNPDPRWVAPPGRSLHRCGTELDLGPRAAYAWLAEAAPRFGFVRRYSWEPWHFGFVDGPAPCASRESGLGLAELRQESPVGSVDGSAGERRAGDGREAGRPGLPAFVPSSFRAPIVAAAGRWNVSASLLAAQLLAESNFNPFAVSPAGARGIAQFTPATARAYGLDDPFDPGSAIGAQARLMADLLERFDDISLALAAYNAGPGAVGACSCVPPYPETRAYVARILGLLGGAGEVAAPGLEVRLVS